MKQTVCAIALAAAMLSIPARASVTVAQGSGQRFLTVATYDPLGQTFTADGDRLQGFGFQLQTVNATAMEQAITLSIYAGSGFTGTLLGSATLTPSALPATRTPTWVDWTFAGLVLTIGQTYTAALTSDTTRVGLVFGPDTNALGNVPLGGDAYSGGRLIATGYNNTICNTGICDANFRTTTSNLAAAVPETASWATMVAGFALIGAALRRRAPRRFGVA